MDTSTAVLRLRIRPKIRPTGFILIHFLLGIFLLTGTTLGSEEDCPWAGAASTSPSTSPSPSGSSRTIPAAIKTNCLCARNPSLNLQLSVQCFEVEAAQLVALLLAHRTKEPLELLYLNASKVADANGQVPARLFRDLKMVSLQISGCEIKSLHPDAFRGQESHLKHLSLTQNLLTEVPKFDRLRNLGLLDFSYNKITKIAQGAFEKLTKLGTLKLNDNNLELGLNAFKGLENSLRNLNLKGTRLSSIPDAIANLSSLAFLDLAQNRLRELDPAPFTRLHSLTALNLERNLLQALPSSVFTGVNDTLSSLSLLNNLITHFPKEALHTLKELRVLDLGFNLLTEIPSDAFMGLTSLTLLALDGNPLTTLPAVSFQQLNATLRGISLGSRFLVCDCRIQWIADWVQRYDLQVTSRERNPQFCGSPAELRAYTFYQLKAEDFKCDDKNETVVSSSTSKSTTTEYNLNLSHSDLALLGLDSNYFGKDDSDAAESEEAEENDYTGATGDDEVVHGSSVKSMSMESKERSPLLHSPISSTANSLEITEDGADDAEADTDKASTFRPSIRPSILTIGTTTKKTLQPIKPFIHLRPKLQPKISTSTSTTTSSSSTSSSAQASVPTIPIPDVARFPRNQTGRPNTNSNSAAILKPKPTSSLASITPVQMPKSRPTPSLDSTMLDIDDSKIPVITGVGPSRMTTTLNTGSVVPVRMPTTTTPATPISRTISTPSSSSGSGSASSQHVQHAPVRPTNLIFAEKSEIVFRNIERNGDSILVQWDGQKQTVFRIIYRFFGEDTFRHGPPLAATERDYRIQNIPYNECIVVCVVPYEEIVYNEINPSPATIPPGSQCKELRPNSPSALMNHMDKITIGASAAICATVLLAVLIFIGITRRSKNSRPAPSIIAKVPLGCSFASPSPGPTTLTTHTHHPSTSSSVIMKEWDQISGLSVRSIPRAQIFHGTNMSMDGNGIGNGPSRSILPIPNNYGQHQHDLQRSIPDGHSTHRSYLSSHHAHHNHSIQSYTKPNNSNNSKNHNSPGLMNNYLNNQSRLLRASLGSRGSQDALNKHAANNGNHRQFEQNQRRRKRGGTGKRISQSDSVNTLSGYETPDNNWTDHDMDVYITRNPTRHDLVQL